MHSDYKGDKLSGVGALQSGGCFADRSGENTTISFLSYPVGSAPVQPHILLGDSFTNQETWLVFLFCQTCAVWVQEGKWIELMVVW